MRLTAQLARTGRAAWVEEEIAALKDPQLYKLDPEQAWKRLKPRTSQQALSGGAGGAGRVAGTRGPGARYSPRPGLEGRSPDRNRRPSAGDTAKALERIRAVPKGFANSRIGKGLMEALEVGARSPARRCRRHTAQPPQARALACRHRPAQDPAQAYGPRPPTWPRA